MTLLTKKPRTKLVQSQRGAGSLSGRGLKPMPVRYELDTYQELSASRSSGWLEGDEAFPPAVAEIQGLTLALQDGRRIALSIDSMPEATLVEITACDAKAGATPTSGK